MTSFPASSVDTPASATPSSTATVLDTLTTNAAIDTSVKRCSANAVPGVGRSQSGKSLDTTKGLAGCHEIGTCHSVQSVLMLGGEEEGVVVRPRARGRCGACSELLVAGSSAAAAASWPLPIGEGSADVTLTASLDGKSIPVVGCLQDTSATISPIQRSIAPLAACSSIHAAALNSLLTSVDYVTDLRREQLLGRVHERLPELQRARSHRLERSDQLVQGPELRRPAPSSWIWFYGGSQWSFCCNSQFASLGGYDNSFSSVEPNVGIPLLTHLLHGPVPWNRR